MNKDALMRYWRSNTNIPQTRKGAKVKAVFERLIYSFLVPAYPLQVKSDLKLAKFTCMEVRWR